MKRNVQKPGSFRPSTARGMQLGMMAIAITIAGSAIISSASTVPKEAQAVSFPAKHSRFAALFGKASWYGGKFNGRKTASGERFDMNALTCAHRTLPLGSWIRVINLHNKKAVILRVNDRGPVPDDVMLDLSYGAARRLDIVGLSKVKVEILRADDPAVLRAMAPKRPQLELLAYASTPSGVPLLPTMIAER